MSDSNLYTVALFGKLRLGEDVSPSKFVDRITDLFLCNGFSVNGYEVRYLNKPAMRRLGKGKNGAYKAIENLAEIRNIRLYSLPRGYGVSLHTEGLSVHLIRGIGEHDDIIHINSDSLGIGEEAYISQCVECVSPFWASISKGLFIDSAASILSAWNYIESGELPGPSITRPMRMHDIPIQSIRGNNRIY
jgi:hypothetical protein